MPTSSRAAFCLLSQSSAPRLVASNARRIPGTEGPVATPEKEAEPQTMPPPTRSPFAEIESGTELEKPLLFCTVLWVTGVVWNRGPTYLYAFRKSFGPHKKTTGPLFGLFQ